MTIKDYDDLTMDELMGYYRSLAKMAAKLTIKHAEILSRIAAGESFNNHRNECATAVRSLQEAAGNVAIVMDVLKSWEDKRSKA